MKKIPNTETRTTEELIEHYVLEKELAQRLRNSSSAERKDLYLYVYDELFRKIPYFQKRIADKKRRQEDVLRQYNFIKNFLKPNGSFIEIGAGDCALSLDICKMQKTVYSVEVVDQIPDNINLPENFKLLLSNGTNIDVPLGSIDLAYSNQLIEHLHPDDVYEQIKNVYKCLRPGGSYIILTPHRYSGPHDISKYFDNVATGFHLKEYTNTELYKIFKSTGFSEVHYYTQRRKYYKISVQATILLEKCLSPLPYNFRKTLFTWPIIRNLLPIRLVSVK